MSGEKKKPVRSYRDLEVWRKSIELSRRVYSATSNFPDSERFGITTQLRRASVSVGSNIAEGQARRTNKDFVQFLYVARGSLAELDTQLTISLQLGYLNNGAYGELLERIDELQRMLFSLAAKIGGAK